MTVAGGEKELHSGMYRNEGRETGHREAEGGDRERSEDNRIT